MVIAFVCWMRCTFVLLSVKSLINLIRQAARAQVHVCTSAAACVFVTGAQLLTVLVA
jgi:hypothetical protein